MTQQVKLNLIPGLEISIDPSGLLFHLAEQTSPQGIALLLFRHYGANPLLDALREGFSAKVAEPLQVEQTKAELAEALEVPALEETIINLNSFTPRECEYNACKKKFIPRNEYQKFHDHNCAKQSWKDKQKEKTKARKLEEVNSPNLLPLCARPDCQKPFKPNTAQQIYCHTNCSKAVWQSKNLDQLKDYQQRRYQAKKAKRIAQEVQSERLQEGEQKPLNNQ